MILFKGQIGMLSDASERIAWACLYHTMATL